MSMGKANLACAGLLVGAFSLTTYLEPWYQDWAGSRVKSSDVLAVALGDGRKLFASHFYVKADAYFHNGSYPTIFDGRSSTDKLHIAEAAADGSEEHKEEGHFLGRPKDWIDSFSRHFFPTTHRHLGEDDHDHSHAHGGQCKHHQDRKSPPPADEREMLPWLRVAATLDPQRPQTYLVASYWLRSRLGKVDEAERFLREGLQSNPGDPELLFELGRIYAENRKDASRARNLWELALQNWRQRESGKVEPNKFVLAQILGNLARLEEEQQNPARATEHLKLLKAISPHKDSIQKWIDELGGESRVGSDAADGP